MKETTITSKDQFETENAVLIEGLPGQGMVGKIAVEYLAKKLKAKKIADLHSPHFAYYVVVDKKGTIRLLRSEFFFWKNKKGESDLMLLTGDSQAQTVEGQYEIADVILDFAQKSNVKMILTIGGYRKEVKEEPEVLASATNAELLKKVLEAGAKDSPSGNPIVGTAGLLVGLAGRKNLKAACLLVETPGYMPDPRAAKSVLIVLMKMLGFKADLSDIDKEILKSNKIEERMKTIEEQRRTFEKKRQKIEEEKVSYIS